MAARSPVDLGRTWVNVMTFKALNEWIPKCVSMFHTFSFCDVVSWPPHLRRGLLRWTSLESPNVRHQNPGWLFYIGDCTTHLYSYYSKPLQGSLLTNQHNSFLSILCKFGYPSSILGLSFLDASSVWSIKTCEINERFTTWCNPKRTCWIYGWLKTKRSNWGLRNKTPLKFL